MCRCNPMHSPLDQGTGGPDQPADLPPRIPQLVPIGDVARALGVTIKTLRRWARDLEGCPQIVTLGPQARFMRRDEVMAWIAERESGRAAAGNGEGGGDARRDGEAPAAGVA